MERVKLAFMVLMAILSEVLSVQIVSVSVPGVVEVGTEDIVLDCDFEYRKEEELQLDIKWYFNKNPNPIYQWVPSQAGPQVISDMFRSHLDLTYEVTEDKFKKHRALHITNPLPHLSGTYMCKVSSFIDEDFDQKELLIYAPPNSIEFDQMNWDDSAPLNVTCAATGMYPQPEAKLTLVYNESSKISYDNAVIIERLDGLIDVSLSTSIPKDQLAVQVTIGCEISLPGTDFFIEERTVFHPRGSGSVARSFSWHSLLLLLLGLHWYK